MSQDRSDAAEHRGVKPRGKGGRTRPSGALQARVRALGASSAARMADLNDPRPECSHAVRDGREVYCTNRAVTQGSAGTFCRGKSCGVADLPPPPPPPEKP